MTNARSVPPEASHYRIPLLVGVVGSRDLVPAQVPAIREELASLLCALRDAQRDVHLQIMCSLAEGADLLVAQIAGELGIDVVALLPASAEQCRAELTNDAARASFDAALRRAERLDVPPSHEASTGADPSPEDELVSQQRERAGALIALYSSLLIVVWDGNEVADRATGRSVERRLGRAGPAYDNRIAEPACCIRRLPCSLIAVSWAATSRLKPAVCSRKMASSGGIPSAITPRCLRPVVNPTTRTESARCA